MFTFIGQESGKVIHNREESEKAAVPMGVGPAAYPAPGLPLEQAILTAPQPATANQSLYEQPNASQQCLVQSMQVGNTLEGDLGRVDPSLLFFIPQEILGASRAQLRAAIGTACPVLMQPSSHKSKKKTSAGAAEIYYPKTYQYGPPLAPDSLPAQPDSSTHKKLESTKSGPGNSQRRTAASGFLNIGKDWLALFGKGHRSRESVHKEETGKLRRGQSLHIRPSNSLEALQSLRVANSNISKGNMNSFVILANQQQQSAQFVLPHSGTTFKTRREKSDLQEVEFEKRKHSKKSKPGKSKKQESIGEFQPVSLPIQPATMYFAQNDSGSLTGREGEGKVGKGKRKGANKGSRAGLFPAPVPTRRVVGTAMSAPASPNLNLHRRVLPVQQPAIPFPEMGFLEPQLLYAALSACQQEQPDVVGQLPLPGPAPLPSSAAFTDLRYLQQQMAPSDQQSQYPAHSAVCI